MNLSVAGKQEYQAEISGWDLAENFFVEKTRLSWGREGMTEGFIHRDLRAGCVVFVRLLRAHAELVDFPIAYRVDTIDAPGKNGQARVALARLHPKAPFREAFFVGAGNANVA